VQVEGEASPPRFGSIPRRFGPDKNRRYRPYHLLEVRDGLEEERKLDRVRWQQRSVTYSNLHPPGAALSHQDKRDVELLLAFVMHLVCSRAWLSIPVQPFPPHSEVYLRVTARSFMRICGSYSAKLAKEVHACDLYAVVRGAIHTRDQ